MAVVAPFRGFRYNLPVVGDLARVLGPPFDDVSASEARALRDGSPYNAVHLELPGQDPGGDASPGSLEKAAGLFRRWQASGALVREPAPAMYVLEERFTHDGEEFSRQALVAAVRLEPPDSGVVLPHENTVPGPTAERQALMRAAGASFSPLLSLYDDDDGTIANLVDNARPREEPVVARTAGRRYRFYPITDPGALSAIGESMKPLRLYLADGHHRYEAALGHLAEREAAGGPLSANAAARYVMMALVRTDDPGLVLLPYHRVITGLAPSELSALRQSIEQGFDSKAVDVSVDSASTAASAIRAELAAIPRGEVAAAVVGLAPGAVGLLTEREPSLHPSNAPLASRCDTWILHHRGISPALEKATEDACTTFVNDANEAVRSVLNGEAQVAFLLRPLPLDVFKRLVVQGERLPPKSTCFYPKPPAGLVFSSLLGTL